MNEEGMKVFDSSLSHNTNTRHYDSSLCLHVPQGLQSLLGVVHRLVNDKLWLEPADIVMSHSGVC